MSKNHQKCENTTGTPEPHDRKTYVPPKLTRLGTLVDITKDGGTGDPDGGIGGFEVGS